MRELELDQPLVDPGPKQQVDRNGHPIGSTSPPPPPPPLVLFTASQLIWRNSLFALLGPMVVVAAYLHLLMKGLDSNGLMLMKDDEWWRQHSNLLAMYSLHVWCHNLTEVALRSAWHWALPIAAMILNAGGFQRGPGWLNLCQRRRWPLTQQLRRVTILMTSCCCSWCCCSCTAGWHRYWATSSLFRPDIACAVTI